MSQTHILSTAGYILCRRDGIRGFITQQDYQRMTADKKTHTRIKTSTKHSCSYREGGKCYVGSAGRRLEVSCVRRSHSASAICQDCARTKERFSL